MSDGEFQGIYEGDVEIERLRTKVMLLSAERTELLAALKGTEPWLFRAFPGEPMINEVRRKMLAAIAKAEGK
jgi:hypothetical protein